MSSLFNKIQDIKNLSKSELNGKKRELIFQDILLEQLQSSAPPYFEYQKNVRYENIIYTKKKIKSNNVFKLGITDFNDRFKNHYGIIEVKFGIYNRTADLNHAFTQLLNYGIYEHKDHFELITESYVKVIFYDENKKLLKKFRNQFRSLLCGKSPSKLGENCKYNFSDFKIHTFKITPEFNIREVQDFIRKHYE